MLEKRKKLLKEKLKEAKESQDRFHYWQTYYRFHPPTNCQEARKAENRSKNHCRYYAYPFDHNQIAGIPVYINASPMPLGSHKYIASQGPRVNTFDDFWNMIWGEEVGLIVSVTNEKEEEGEGIDHKFDAFWPKEKSEKYGDVSVELTAEALLKKWEDQRNEQIVLRSMQVDSGSEKRTVNHLHMENWMDNDVVRPDSLIALSHAADQCKGDGAILVHCAAGIGRTGTFIAFHSLYHDMLAFLQNEEATFDVVKRVAEMRELRYGAMIAERRQFLLLVEALSLALESS